jgi:hypothetical protein
VAFSSIYHEHDLNPNHDPINCKRGGYCGERRGKERGRKKERSRGRSLDIAPSHTPICCYGKGSRILVIDLSRKLLTHVERPGI